MGGLRCLGVAILLPVFVIDMVVAFDPVPPLLPILSIFRGRGSLKAKAAAPLTKPSS